MPRPIVPAPITAILFTSIAYLRWPICHRDAEPAARPLAATKIERRSMTVSGMMFLAHLLRRTVMVRVCLFVASKGRGAVSEVYLRLRGSDCVVVFCSCY